MPVIRRYQIRGIVQGVGFRPFVFRVAEQHSLGGWVLNDSTGVILEVQGEAERLEAFIAEVCAGAPPLARIESVALLEERDEATRYQEFKIESSSRGAKAATLVSPDSAVCSDCLRELFDPADRRYRYPYINCTNCGPRYTIMEGVPYDRATTTMSHFRMCGACAEEYGDPRNRRFHAQPVACWDCGPRLRMHGAPEVEESPDPIATAAQMLKAGRILAVKGLGGFHVMVDARNEEAVVELRRRKRRDERPFALMSGSVEAIRAFANLTAVEEYALRSPASPILLLRRRSIGGIAPSVAPGNRRLGVMLAYTPVHHLLLGSGLDTVVATSGNVSGEPITFEDEDATARLAPIADAFLLGDRPIHTRVDDSIGMVAQLGDRTVSVPLRRARGLTPSPIKAPFRLPPLLAVGAHLKNTVCLSREEELFVSHHIGDLDTRACQRSFEAAVVGLETLLEVKPGLIAHDKHPQYASTAFARDQRAPMIAVQHHHAHMAACMCEHGLQGPVLGVIFDGTGYGDDGHIWGGEFLLGDYGGYERCAHLRYCPMPGGDRATQEPFRVALALLHQAFGPSAEVALPVVTKRSAEERRLFTRMIAQGVNSPLSSSAGRLFDGVAALVGVRETVGYEAQAAIELEQLLEPGMTSGAGFAWDLDGDVMPMQIDPRPAIRELVALLERSESELSELSLRFHATVVDMVVGTCREIRERRGTGSVVLSGGVFQNQFLLAGCHDGLLRAGFEVYLHEQVPTNDGGVSLGQAAIAGWAARC